MPVNLPAPDIDTLFPIAGVKIGVTEAGIRKTGRKDLTVVLLDEGASVAGVFTTNRFCAAPVQICRQHLASGLGVRAMLINTGNANAGTGADGMMRANSTARHWHNIWVWRRHRYCLSRPASSWSPCRTTALSLVCRPPLPMRSREIGCAQPKAS